MYEVSKLYLESQTQKVWILKYKYFDCKITNNRFAISRKTKITFFSTWACLSVIKLSLTENFSLSSLHKFFFHFRSIHFTSSFHFLSCWSNFISFERIKHEGCFFFFVGADFFWTKFPLKQKNFIESNVM